MAQPSHSCKEPYAHSLIKEVCSALPTQTLLFSVANMWIPATTSMVQ